MAGWVEEVLEVGPWYCLNDVSRCPIQRDVSWAVLMGVIVPRDLWLMRSDGLVEIAESGG